MAELDGMRVAILATDGVEEDELKQPADLLARAGARLRIVALHGGRIQAYRGEEPGETMEVAIAVGFARPDNYDALLLPGGERSIAALEGRDEVIAFIQTLAQEGKPVAALGKGPRLLVATGLADGMAVTGHADIRSELERAGASWRDGEVIADGNLVTSPSVREMQAFGRELIAVFVASRTPVAPEIQPSPP